MKKTLSNEALASLCFKLSMLMETGSSDSEALTLLAAEGDEDGLLSELSARMDQDSSVTLADAMQESGVFPPYVVGLVRAGETTGHLVRTDEYTHQTEGALKALSDYYESRIRLEQRIRSALLYPAVMLALMLVVIGVLLVKVLPIFDGVYASLGGRLTGVAGGLLTLGRWMDRAMPVLWIVLILLALFAGAFALSASFREKILRFWRKNRGGKGIAHTLNAARLAQAMAMGIESGLSMEETVSLASGLMDESSGVKARCEDCIARLKENVPECQALKESGLLPESQCRLLDLGYKSAREVTAMKKIASDLSDEGEAALDALVGRVEPALVLICSILVGLILLSVMLPLMHIMAAIG